MLRLSLFALVFALGCAEVVEEVPAEEVQQQLAGCTSKWECGSNSPVIATFPFYELDTLGLPNDEGFIVMGLWKGNTQYALHVENGKIIGRGAAGTIQDAGLKKAQIRLRRDTSYYAIEINDVTTAETWAKVAGQSKPLQMYYFRTSPLVNGNPIGWEELCSNPPPSNDSPDALGLPVKFGLVFEGDRIIDDMYEVRPKIERRWFNITCTGHALAKMAANGFTEASRSLGFNTTTAERQTFLKMVAGDYCGTGDPFTVAGQPLEWADWRGYVKYIRPVQELTLEARWTPAGAACLNTPRVDSYPTDRGNDVFGGNVAAMIANRCPGKPTCLGGVGAFNGTTLLSANPPSPP